MEEQISIPSSWAWATIDDIGIIVSGSTPSTKEEDNFGGDISWLTPADLSKYDGKYIKKGKRNLTEKGLKSSSATLLPEGSILFSSRAPIGYTVIAANPISTNQGFKNLIPSKEIFNEYIFHYLKGSKNLAESFASGTTFKELSARRFKVIPVPIPPFNEQVRLVSKIEELFSRLDQGVKALHESQTMFRHYRQSVLKKAFLGMLTNEWREHNKPNNSNQLLESIKKEGVNASEGKYTQTNIETSSLIKEIPSSWNWTTLPNITLNFDGKRIPVKKDDRKKMSGLYPYYGASGIIDYVDDYLYEGEYLLFSEDGANLIARSTPIAFIAKGKFWVNNHAHVLKTLGNIPLKYLEYYLNYISLNSLITGTAQPKLTQRNMNKIPICIPSLNEQKKIVEILDNIFSVIEINEKNIKDTSRNCEIFKQSILKQAFSGLLVPQDPNDEPASELLKRIKAEKAKEWPIRRGGRRKIGQGVFTFQMTPVKKEIIKREEDELV